MEPPTGARVVYPTAGRQNKTRPWRARVAPRRGVSFVRRGRRLDEDRSGERRSVETCGVGAREENDSASATVRGAVPVPPVRSVKDPPFRPLLVLPLVLPNSLRAVGLLSRLVAPLPFFSGR